MDICFWIHSVLNAWNYQFDAAVKDAVFDCIAQTFFSSPSFEQANEMHTLKWLRNGYMCEFFFQIFKANVSKPFISWCQRSSKKNVRGAKKGLAKMQGYSSNSIEMSKDMKIKGKSWHPVHVYCIVYCYLAAFPLFIWLQTRHSGPDKMPLCLLYQRRNHMKTQRNGNNICSARKKKCASNTWNVNEKCCCK